MKPMAAIKAIAMAQNTGLSKGNAIFLSANSLNQFTNNLTSTMENTKARATNINDSLKNWEINCHFADPTALRTPTSFALFSDRAVLKFIKLIQANSNTKIP